MPRDGTMDDVHPDLEILKVVTGHLDGLQRACLKSGAPMKTLRRWFLGHGEPPRDPDRALAITELAIDLELFTPSVAGKTAIDRHVRTRPTTDTSERAAPKALASARFRLVRIIDRTSPVLMHLEDLVTGEPLVLIDSTISSRAVGAVTAMRLCPLPSGRHLCVTPPFAVDEAALAAAMSFARPGRGAGLHHRCAAALYRDIARRGSPLLPLRDADDLGDGVDPSCVADGMSHVEHLARQVVAAGAAGPSQHLVDDIRRAASIDNLIDACGCFGQPSGRGVPAGLRSAYELIAEIQMDTIVQRAQAGIGGYANAMDRVEAAIGRHVAQGAMATTSRELFERLKRRLSYRGTQDRASSDRGETGSSDDDELDRVIQRIQALRAKTTDRGCTEAEAMAATAKIAELLDRHDLTLDAISVRQAVCVGVAIDSGRRRRGPVDSCHGSIAAFCDCRVWVERSESGELRYIYFGLKADVEAARALHDLIDTAFETETARFRERPIYLAHQGGHRRSVLNSFQVGLAHGICAKLHQLKEARRAAVPRSGGFDLVLAKNQVLDAEIDKLGLNFSTYSSAARRQVHSEAYAAGESAGLLFQPDAPLAHAPEAVPA